MGIFSSLFGSETVVNKTVDGIYNGVDKAIYTDEEKAVNELKKVELKRLVLAAYEPFKIAQRLLAFIFCVPFVFLIVLNVISVQFFDADVSAQMKLIDDTLSLPVSLIVGFYFGGGLAEGAIEAWKRKHKD